MRRVELDLENMELCSANQLHLTALSSQMRSLPQMFFATIELPEILTKGGSVNGKG